MELALKRIEECRKYKSPTLDLSDCGLRVLPDEITQLEWLTRIEFSANYDNAYNRNRFYSDESIYSLSNVLSKLPLLVELSINNCSLRNITFLSNLVNLNVLSLNENFILNDITPLTNLVNLEKIELRDTSISDIRPLSNLKKLTRISLVDNNISDIRPLSNLNSLIELHIGKNKISDITALGKLYNLRSLGIATNTISDITPLKKLKNIEALYAFDNQISDIKPLSQLEKLTTLRISGNQISDIKPLSQLKNLLTLSISENQISDIQPLIHLINLESIYLRNNPIKTIPSEMLDFEAIEDKFKEDFSIDLTAIEDFKNLITTYYASIERHGKQFHTDTKLILVGNSTAGKTSLSQILRGLNFNEKEPTTHGIKVKQWLVKGKDLPFLKAPYKNYQADIRIWDFGGQEYYHGTHRLFLDTNAVYMLLWEEKTNRNSPKETVLYSPTEQKQSLAHFHYQYWLDNIRYYAPAATDAVKSPILMVQNKVEEDKPIKSILVEPTLCAHYQVHNTFPLSAKLAKTNKESDKKYKYWFELLKEDLLQTIFEKVHQNAVYIPTMWAKISQWISTLAFDEMPLADNPFVEYIQPNTSYILLDDFRHVCKTLDSGMTDFETNLLKDYLNNKGILFHRPGMNKIFIKSTWVTEGIYKILNEEVLEKQGKFTFADVLNTFPDRDEARLLRDLMKDNDIIYTLSEDNNEDIMLRDETKEVFIAPQYLSPEHPMQDVFRIATIGLKAVSYTVKLPMFFYKKVLDTLIFDYGSSPSVSAREYWKYGILFMDYKEETRIMIQGSRLDEEPQEGRITVSIEPKGDFRKQQKNIFNKIRAIYENPQLSFDGKRFVTLKDIQESATNQSFKIPSSTGEWLRLKDFDVFLDMDIPKPLSVFISYAHKDIDMMNNLLAHLSPLKRLERVETWSDQQLLAGEQWNEKILNRLHEADIILLLLSADFLASNYIWEKELKVAIEKHKNQEARVIPILLRDCQWKEIPFLSSLQTIPHNSNGRLVAIRSWENQNFDEALSIIVQKIQSSIEAWQPKTR